MNHLTYRIVDDLEQAHAYGLSQRPSDFVARTDNLGVYLYLVRSIQSNNISPEIANLIDSSNFKFVECFMNDTSQKLLYSERHGIVLIKVTPNFETDHELSLRALSLIKAAGFKSRPALEIVASLSEFYSNAIEHSKDSNAAIVGFELSHRGMTVIASDIGIGVQSSLKENGKFANLNDDGEALRLCIQEGVSSKLEPNRGHGFRPIFRGLSNYNGYIRFRSGEAVLEVTGVRDLKQTSEVLERSFQRGFHVFAHCQP